MNATSLEKDEILSLRLEYQWLLNEEVNVIFSQLHNILLECSRRFPVSLGLQTLVKTEKYNLTSNQSSNQDHLKVYAILAGDDISQADINIKLHKHSNPNQRYLVQSTSQWKLHQIQDASNHLMAALSILKSPPLRYIEKENKVDFKTADEVIQVINNIMSSLLKGRNSLITPKKRTLKDIQHSMNNRSLTPLPPKDIAISFYIQSHKLICAVYHSFEKDSHSNPRFDIYQAESSIPWLSEVLVLFTVGLQTCQSLKDKLLVFTQYSDLKSEIKL